MPDICCPKIHLQHLPTSCSHHLHLQIVPDSCCPKLHLQLLPPAVQVSGFCQNLHVEVHVEVQPEAIGGGSDTWQLWPPPADSGRQLQPKAPTTPSVSNLQFLPPPADCGRQLQSNPPPTASASNLQPPPSPADLTASNWASTYSFCQAPAPPHADSGKNLKPEPSPTATSNSSLHPLPDTSRCGFHLQILVDNCCLKLLLQPLPDTYTTTCWFCQKPEFRHAPYNRFQLLPASTARQLQPLPPPADSGKNLKSKPLPTTTSNSSLHPLPDTCSCGLHLQIFAESCSPKLNLLPLPATCSFHLPLQIVADSCLLKLHLQPDICRFLQLHLYGKHNLSNTMQKYNGVTTVWQGW